MATDPLAEAQPDSLEHSVLSRADADADNRHAGIEFRDVRYFAAVAEELHFGRAAARLYISQPGLSQAIARLERELGAQLFTRTRSNVELTEAGTELLDRARGLLAGLDDAVTRVRMVGRGVAGLVRVGVALLTEPVVAPALKAFQEEHEAIVVDRSAMVSERLLAQLAEGRLHAAVVHQIPALATVEAVEWEPLRRGRLAVLASPGSKLALREAVSLSELSDQTLLVNPRSLAPGAFEGLKLMCREFGGFDPTVLESAAASIVVLDTDWRPIQDGTAVVVMAEATARAVRPAHVAVVPIQPPPQYVLALAWRRGERAAAAHRFLSCLRSYRDRHAWTTDPEPARDQSQPAGLFVNGNRKLHGANQDSPDAADADMALSPGEPDRKDADPAMRAELDGCDRVQLSASRSREARPDSVSPKPELELADRAAAGCVELVRVVDS